MGVVTTTVTTASCDRCGRTRQADWPSAEGGMRIVAFLWSVGLGGATGGAERAYVLCMPCTEGFNDWITGSGEP